MKIRTTLAAIAAACSMNAHAQNVTYEAVQIAQISMERNWKVMDQQIMPMVYRQVETNFQKGGLSAGGASIVSEELRSRMNKDNFTQLVAQSIANELTVEEQQQTLSFLRSPAGAKFQQAMGDTENTTKLLLPIFNQTCTAAMARLAEKDKPILKNFCSKI